MNIDEMSLDEEISASLQIIVQELKEKGYSDNEIKETTDKIDFDKVISEIIDVNVKEKMDYFRNHMYEIAHERKVITYHVIAHQEELWGKCFAASDTMYTMAVESAKLFSDYVNNKVDEKLKNQKQYTFLSLQHMHGRICQQYLEIMYLLKLGFADGAYARWRSMYELCCCMEFIKMQGEIVAKRYFDCSESNIRKFDWASGVKKKNDKLTTGKGFSEIQEFSELNPLWKKQYDLACWICHPSPQGTFNRLANVEGMNAVPVGHSDYGIAMPAEHATIMLDIATTIFLTLFNNADALLYAGTITEWVKIVQKMYYSTHRELFGEVIKTPHTIIRIEEEDYGCEGVPDGEDTKYNVLVQDEKGIQKWIQLSGKYLDENNLSEGDIIELDSDVYSD